MMSNTQNDTLVVVLCETRAHRLTGELFMQNVITNLRADLAVCVGINKNTEKPNIFYENATYVWEQEEPEDAGELYDAVALQENSQEDWRSMYAAGTYGAREGMRFFGCVKDSKQVSCAAFLHYYRWFLLQKIRELSLQKKYKWFVITRSDYMWKTPHPPTEYLNTDNIYIPNAEHYGGYNDRHMIVSAKHVESVLSMMEAIIHRPKWLLQHFEENSITGIEDCVKLWINLQGLSANVRLYPYTMYTVREKNGSTSWSHGQYYPQYGYCIKYPQSEYVENYLVNQRFIQTNQDWYKQFRYEKKCIVITTINPPTKQILHYAKMQGWDLIIVADSKTNDSLYAEVDCIYLGIAQQYEMYPTLFDKVPLKSYTRKMFGYLYAIQHKYQVIYDTDDDNQYTEFLDIFYASLKIEDGMNYPDSDIKRIEYPHFDADEIVRATKHNSAAGFTFDKINRRLWLKYHLGKPTKQSGVISGNVRSTKTCSTPGFVNIYKAFTDTNIWPRGIPPEHESIAKSPVLTDELCTMECAVIQGLVNNDPDVDAYYRINISNQPFSFEKDEGYDIIMDKYAVCPFNTQNTFWTDPSMFYAMYLPVSVTFRYTDILRGFIALYQLWKNDKTIKFTYPTAVQERNEHLLTKDYESEMTMYKTAEQVVRLLNENKDATIQHIYLILYKNGIVTECEMGVLKEWMRLIDSFSKE